MNRHSWSNKSTLKGSSPHVSRKNLDTGTFSEPSRNACKETFTSVPTPYENCERNKIADDHLMNDIRKDSLTQKLRKMMAVEIMKNRMKGDLRKMVKQIHDHTQYKEFVVLGGGPQSLNYLTRKCSAVGSRPSNNRKTKGLDKKGFQIEVDVRGYIPDNVSINTDNNRMCITATKVNGNEKSLRILAPSITAMEMVKVHPPKAGVLLLQYSL